MVLHAVSAVSQILINWNPAREPHLLAADIDPIDERFQVGRIAFRAYLNLERAAIRRIFVAVKPVAHRPDRLSKLAFLFPLDDHTRQQYASLRLKRMGEESSAVQVNWC